MKVVVAGAWQWSWYQQAFANALEALGHTVRGVGWAEFFYRDLHTEQPTPRSSWTRLQQRTGLGPIVTRFNRRLVDTILEFRPEVVLAYNATLVLPATLKRIKLAMPRILLAQYCNDNPFSKQADWWLWRHVRRSIPIYDLHFVYRHSNDADIRQLGGRCIHLLRSYYVPDTDFRVEVGRDNSRFLSDVLFAGHYEHDNRLELLENVAKLDVNFKLFGGTWQRAEPLLSMNSRLRRQFPVRSLSKADYRKAISGTKIALCFLSKLNGDSYTRRSFEIPAMQTFMLSEYSDDLASLYEPGTEAEFFRTKDELVSKIGYYLKNDDARQAIARKGHARLLRDGHDVVSRAKEFVNVVDRHMRGAIVR